MLHLPLKTKRKRPIMIHHYVEQKRKPILAPCPQITNQMKKKRVKEKKLANKYLQSIWNFGEEHNTIDTNIPSLSNLVQTMLTQKLVRNSTK
jgi:hypothetical protein